MTLSDFECVKCGCCCRWPGPVRVSESEISAIAGFLNIDETDFISRFTRLTADRRGLSLLEKTDASCLYLSDDNRCLIQEVKPRQCRDFPYKWNFPNWRNECKGAVK